MGTQELLVLSVVQGLRRLHKFYQIDFIYFNIFIHTSVSNNHAWLAD